MKNEEWNRTFEGNRSDIVNVVRQTFDGGYILAGSTWPSDGDDMVGKIMQTTDEGYLVTGTTGWWDEHTYKQHNDIRKIWIIKIDTDGNFQWHTSFGDGHDGLTGVQQKSDGGLILAGNKEKGINKGIDFWLMKLGEKSPESLEISNQSQLVPAQTTNVPGFEILFSIGNLLAVTCLVLRMKRK